MTEQAGRTPASRGGFAQFPAPLRHSAVLGALFALLGAAAGLARGLQVYPATAWAAMFEIAIPAAVLGYLLGLLTGSVEWLVHRVRA